LKAKPHLSSLTFANGLLWGVSREDGTAVVVDPARRVVRSLPLGGTPAGVVAVGNQVLIPVRGAGLTATSSAGPTAGDIRTAAAGPVSQGAKSRPQFLIASSFALNGPDGRTGQDLAAAVLATLRQHGFRAGRFTLGYQSCNEGTESVNCTANGR